MADKSITAFAEYVVYAKCIVDIANVLECFVQCFDILKQHDAGGLRIEKRYCIKLCNELLIRKMICKMILDFKIGPVVGFMLWGCWNLWL